MGAEPNSSLDEHDRDKWRNNDALLDLWLKSGLKKMRLLHFVNLGQALPIPRRTWDSYLCADGFASRRPCPIEVLQRTEAVMGMYIRLSSNYGLEDSRKKVLRRNAAHQRTDNLLTDSQMAMSHAFALASDALRSMAEQSGTIKQNERKLKKAREFMYSLSSELLACQTSAAGLAISAQDYIQELEKGR